jgi:hypothetical protein
MFKREGQASIERDRRPKHCESMCVCMSTVGRARAKPQMTDFTAQALC